MSRVQACLDYLDRDPDDLTVVCGLIDALIEERDMTRYEADRYAERARQAALDARDVAAAADLLKSGQAWHDELVGDVIEEAGLPRDTVAQIVVGPGEGHPRFTNPPDRPATGFWYETTVVVGARWLTAYWRRNASLCLMQPTKKTRRPRSR